MTKFYVTTAIVYPNAAPHLGWLVDRWAAPPWVPYANVFSVGDILIAVGGFVFALAATGVLDRLRLFGHRASYVQ